MAPGSFFTYFYELHPLFFIVKNNIEAQIKILYNTTQPVAAPK
jgi:hypothetical protein